MSLSRLWYNGVRRRYLVNNRIDRPYLVLGSIYFCENSLIYKVPEVSNDTPRTVLSMERNLHEQTGCV